MTGEEDYFGILDKLKRTMTEKEEKLREQDQEINNLEEKFADKSKELSNKTKEVWELKELNKKYEKTIDESKKEKYLATIQRKNDEIEELIKEKGELKEKIGQYAQKIEAYGKRSAEFERCDEFKKKITNLEFTIVENKKTLDGKDEKIFNAEKERDEYKRLFDKFGGVNIEERMRGNENRIKELENELKLSKDSHKEYLKIVEQNKIEVAEANQKTLTKYKRAIKAIGIIAAAGWICYAIQHISKKQKEATMIETQYVIPEEYNNEVEKMNEAYRNHREDEAIMRGNNIKRLNEEYKNSFEKK